MQRTTKVTEQTLTGTSIVNWFQLLRDNKFKISWCYLPRALFISLITSLTAPFALYEKLRYRKKIKQTKITKPPVFIIGHWRSGTTFLHTLMIKDQNFAYVSNMQAFMPSVFISGGRLFKHVLKRLLPAKRRMDNVRLGIHEPQEEEYALANLSSMSLYHGMVFPQNLREYSKFCSLDGLPEKKVAKWKKVFQRFLQKITYYSHGKQLILKNPSNTFRIKLLLEMYPRAKFIHIYRNPYDVYLSTLKMYNELFPYFFLQEPYTDQEGQDFIIDLYEEMFIKYFAEKDLIPDGNLIEVKYEDFVENPIQGLQAIYQSLDLKYFEESNENFNSYLESVKGYKKNKHELDETVIEKISSRWQFTVQRWGYSRIERVVKRIERKGTRLEKRSERKEKRPEQDGS